MKKFLILACSAVLLLLPLSAKAAYLRASNNRDEVIGADQKIKNAYIAASNIKVDADVQKDLAVAGSNLNINGAVQNSLFAAGNNIDIKGNVGDSVRACGSGLTIDSIVGGDALLAGNSVIFSKKSKIEGDLIAAANRSELNGTILGSVKLIGADIIIAGNIKGDVLIRGVQNLTVTKDAVIDGKLTYYSQNQANIENGSAILGTIDYHKTQGTDQAWKPYARKASMAYALYQIIGSILLLLLFVYLAPKNSKKFVAYSFAEVFRNLWWGLLVLIVAPILALILIAISFKLSVVILLAYSLLLTLASVFSALLVGSWLLKAFNKSGEFPLDWQSIILGVIIVALLPFIPFLGALILFILLLISIGSIFKLTYEGIAR